MEPEITRTVLTVDDDEFVREILAAYLEDSGYEVLQAENGLLGLETFRREKPDLVMLDLRMPEMDGLGSIGIYNQGVSGHPGYPGFRHGDYW